MPKQRFKVIPAVYLILERDGKVLLMRRQKTGYQDGNFGLPSGHKEAGEHPTEALYREILEEIGVTLRPEDVRFAHVMTRIGDVESERVDLFFATRNWQGEPNNMEPEKCDLLEWYSLDDLPTNAIPYIKVALEHWRDGVTFSEIKE